VVGDSKVVVDWFNGVENLECMVFSPWQWHIHELQEYFASISINHTYHVFNRQEDFLSKEALGMVEGILISREFCGEELVSEAHQQLY
jgi:hypothetical protein